MTSLEFEFWSRSYVLGVYLFIFIFIFFIVIGKFLIKFFCEKYVH